MKVDPKEAARVLAILRNNPGWDADLDGCGKWLDADGCNVIEAALEQATHSDMQVLRDLEAWQQKDPEYRQCDVVLSGAGRYTVFLWESDWHRHQRGRGHGPSLAIAVMAALKEISHD